MCISNRCAVSLVRNRSSSKPCAASATASAKNRPPDVSSFLVATLRVGTRKIRLARQCTFAIQQVFLTGLITPVIVQEQFGSFAERCLMHEGLMKFSTERPYYWLFALLAVVGFVA